MEIISIPLEGDLEHQDSMEYCQGRWYSGDERRYRNFHSEYNKNKDQLVKFYRFDLSKSKKNNASLLKLL
jgi:hypothetical protein